MKRTKAIILSLLLLLSLLFGGCADGDFTQNDNSPEINQPTIVTEIEEVGESQTEENSQDEEKGEEKQDIADDLQENNQVSKQENKSFSLTNVPAYNGKAYVAVNNNEPFFFQADYTTKSFERYSSLDGLGRCGVVFDNV